MKLFSSAIPTKQGWCSAQNHSFLEAEEEQVAFIFTVLQSRIISM
jgi:hypothetical protein